MKRLATLVIVIMPLSSGAAADCTEQRKAVAASPQNFALHLAVAACETRQGRPQRATENYRQAARLRPGEPGIWNDLGANLIAVGRDEEAVTALRKATALNPKGESAWFNLGGTLLKLGRPAEAFTALDNATKLAPRDQEISAARREAATQLLATAENHVRRREYTKAQKLLNTAPVPDSAAWNNLTGYAEFKLNQPVPALDHLQKALRLDPENESYLLDIGEFLVHYRANKAAREIFEIAAGHKPRSAPVQFMLAVNYILEDRRPEGIAVLKNILELDPDFEPAYRALGECYDEAKDADALVKLGEQLVARSPRSATGFHLKGLGLLWMAIESRAPLGPAIDALRTAAQLDPAFTENHFALAKAYQWEEQHAQAIAELEQTIRLNPQHDRAHFLLATLYRRAGNQQRADEELKLHNAIKSKPRALQMLVSARER